MNSYIRDQLDINTDLMLYYAAQYEKDRKIQDKKSCFFHKDILEKVFNISCDILEVEIFKYIKSKNPEEKKLEIKKFLQYMYKEEK